MQNHYSAHAQSTCKCVRAVLHSAHLRLVYMHTDFRKGNHSAGSALMRVQNLSHIM